MLTHLIASSVRHRWLVLAAWALAAVVGVVAFQGLPIDAVPDITNVQVQINTEAPGYSPFESEQRITVPLEATLAGLPRLVELRSLSKYGLSQITVVFEDGTDVYWARQLVGERLRTSQGNIPEGVEPDMGPVTTGLGEVFFWVVHARPDARTPDGRPYTSTDLRTIQDWIVRPQVRTVPGVAEVNTIGGHARQLHVLPDPARLMALGLTFHDLLRALRENNADAGAGYIERRGEQLLVRVPGRVSTLEEIRSVVVDARRGTPVLVADVAEVAEGHDLRTGAATENGHEVVLGNVMMLAGENSREVARRVAERMVEVNRSMPPGVEARTVYDRTRLVDATLTTVEHNLLMGAALVIVVLLMFLGNVRAAIITAVVIPLAMGVAVLAMRAWGVSGNLLSLGALDFGIIVDGAVIVVERCVRRLSERCHSSARALTRDEADAEVVVAATEVLRPAVFGQVIIMIVYLPILTLQGVEGKMFTPMAFTVVAAMMGALLLSVTFVPAAAAVGLGRRVSEWDNPVFMRAVGAYARALVWCMRRRVVAVVTAISMCVAAVQLATRMGSEFLPSLDEGDLLVHALRIPGTSLTSAITMQQQLERTLLIYPEVDYVFAKLGTADIATDPMPPSVADTYVMLKPRETWPDPARPTADLVRQLNDELRRLPGNNYEFTQPIQMRFNELIAGVRADVAVKVFGDDPTVLSDHANAIEEVLRGVPGASDVQVEQVTGLPMLSVEMNRGAMARFGFNGADLQTVVSAAIAGTKVGDIYDGDRRFDLMVRLPTDLREDPQALEHLPVAVVPGAATDGQGPHTFVPLESVARFVTTTGPNQIGRENGKRRVIVTANVRDRDIGSFVADAQARIAREVALPPGYWIGWGGEFQQLESARARLTIVVPIALVLIVVLLIISIGSGVDAAIVFTGVPLALTGGIAALALREMPISITAAVGFIALSGIAVLNGLVMVALMNRLRQEGMSGPDAAVSGALQRFRPVLMTALVAALGFVPMALASGTGSEVQRPLATVVIGGILSSTLLTLFVLPALYGWVHRSVNLDRRKIPDGDESSLPSF
jgi:cobalt-zinc-cadmium resistance protein CzcA